jgi:hypothetical protein
MAVSASDVPKASGSGGFQIEYWQFYGYNETHKVNDLFCPDPGCSGPWHLQICRYRHGTTEVVPVNAF